jgi:hypothetical protein
LDAWFERYDFSKFQRNLVWKLNLNLIKPRQGHMARSGWLVPVRLDHCRGTLDLTGSGRTRCARTDSLKWIYLNRSIKIERTRKEEERAHRLGFTIRRRCQGPRLGSECRRRSRASRSRGRRGRCVIRLQRIYNFWCSMLVFTPFA